MTSVTSRGHVFEANLNRLSILPQVYRTKTSCNLRQDASIKHGEPGRVDPIHDLGTRLHPNPAAPAPEVVPRRWRAQPGRLLVLGRLQLLCQSSQGVLTLCEPGALSFRG